MKISFLLVNYNMGPMVEQCLKGLLPHLSSVDDFEFIVLDNSEDPDFRLSNEVVQEVPNLRLIHEDDNEGFVKSLNKIIPLVCFDHVVIMHPDVELKDGTLDKLARFLEGNPKVGLVSPNLYYPNGTENKIRLKFPELQTEFLRLCNVVSSTLFKRTFLQDEVLWNHKMDAEAEMLMSVFILLRKEVLAQVDSLDERLWTYYANDFLCSEAGKRGWACWYLSDAKAIHYERFSDPKLFSSKKSSEYKTTAIPISFRMERDKFVFLSTRHGRFYWSLLKSMTLMEYSIHYLAASLKRRKDKAESMRSAVTSLLTLPYRN